MYIEKYNEIIIREINENDIESLSIFLMEIYQIKISNISELYNYYYWKYIENYNTYKFIKSLIAIQKNKIVGFLGLGNYELKVNDRIVKACWAMDWMTIKNSQTKGLGKFLLKLAINNNKNVHVTTTELSPIAENIFLNLGFIKYEIGKTITIYSIKSLRRLNKRKMINVVSLKIKSIIYNPFNLINKSISCEKSNISELVLNNQGDGSNIDFSYLNWLLKSNQFNGEVLKLYYNKNEVGYCIYNRFDKNNLKIIRILYYSLSNNYFRSLINLLNLRHKKIDIVEIKVANNVSDYLSSFGFYNSPTFFWAQSNLEINPQYFRPSFSDKDTAYRGVNNII
jgi:hypothetical protein